MIKIFSTVSDFTVYLQNSFVNAINSLRPKSIAEAEKGYYTYWNRTIVSEEVLITIRLCACVVM